MRIMSTVNDLKIAHDYFQLRKALKSHSVLPIIICGIICLLFLIVLIVKGPGGINKDPVILCTVAICFLVLITGLAIRRYTSPHWLVLTGASSEVMALSMLIFGLSQIFRNPLSGFIFLFASYSTGCEGFQSFKQHALYSYLSKKQPSVDSMVEMNAAIERLLWKNEETDKKIIRMSWGSLGYIRALLLPEIGVFQISRGITFLSEYFAVEPNEVSITTGEPDKRDPKDVNIELKLSGRKVKGLISRESLKRLETW
jgi:uncharacterized membrane protein